MKTMDKVVDMLYKRIHDLDTLETHFQQQLKEIERDRDELHELCRQDKALIHDQCVKLQELRLQRTQLRAQLSAVEISERECHVRCGHLEDTVCRLQDRVDELQVHEQRLLELFRHLKVTEKLWPKQPSDQDDVPPSQSQFSTQELCSQSKAREVEKEKDKLIINVHDLEKFDKYSEQHTQASNQDGVNGDMASQQQQSVEENLRLWHHVSHQHAQLEVLHSQLSASGEVALELRQRVDMLQDKKKCLLEQVRAYQSRDVDLQSRVEELERSEEALKVKVSELQHRENCLLARLVEYDTIGCQVLDTLPLAQKQQLPQTLEACQRRVLVLTRLLEDAQRQLLDNERQHTQTDRQPSDSIHQQKQVQKQLSGSHHVDTRKSEDVQWQVCDDVPQQEHIQQQLYENHLQTEQIPEQLSDNDYQQEQAQRQLHEKDFQDNKRIKATQSQTQMSDIDLQREQAQRQFCENHHKTEQAERQLPDNDHRQELDKREKDPHDDKRTKATQQQLCENHHHQEQALGKNHQEDKTKTAPQQLSDNDHKDDRIEDHGSQLSDNDPQEEQAQRQHEEDHQDDHWTEAVEQMCENCCQQVSEKSHNQDLAQSHRDENDHHPSKDQEYTEKIASITKATGDTKCEDGTEARDDETNRMTQDIKQKAGQRQENDKQSKQNIDSSKDIVELFEGLQDPQLLLSSEAHKQLSQRQAPEAPTRSDTRMWRPTPRGDRQCGERGAVPEPPSHLRVERVEGDSVVLAWQPPVLDQQGCSNGARVVGYRIYLNGRVCQQPHNPALASTTIKGVRRSRDPARAQQRLAIETLTASGQVSPRLHLVMALQRDGHSTATDLSSSETISSATGVGYNAASRSGDLQSSGEISGATDVGDSEVTRL